MTEHIQHIRDKRNFWEQSTKSCRRQLSGSKSSDVPVISSSIIWPSLIPAAWRIPLKTLTSPECRPVRQSPPWHSSVCLPPPRALIPLAPRGRPRGTSLHRVKGRMEGWSDPLWLTLPSLQVKVAILIKKHTLCSAAYLLSTRLFRGIEPQSQEGNGDPCPPESASSPPWAALQLTCSSGVRSDKCQWEVRYGGNEWGGSVVSS